MLCQVCGKTVNLKSCDNCFQVYYCSREHQLIGWKSHKKWCKENSKSNINNFNLIYENQRKPNNPTSLFSDNNINGQICSQRNDMSFSNKLTNVCDNISDDKFNYYNEFSEENNYSLSSTQQNNDFEETIENSQICHSVLNKHVTTGHDSFNDSNSLSHNLSSQNCDFILNNLNKYCQIILDDMNKYGFCVIDDFLQNGDLILNEVMNLYHRGLFRAGQVVNNRANSDSKLIRGDQIIWVEGNEPICNNIGFLIRILDSIITRCNAVSLGEFYKHKINRRTKAMIACYPGNYSKYVRHVDNPNNDGRCITSIYYLNKEYDRERDGGVLRLFPQMNDGIVADVEPKFNRVIFFWSDRRNPHEVMPSTRMRFAITVWYFDANERAKAIQKYNEKNMQCPNDKNLVPF